MTLLPSVFFKYYLTIIIIITVLIPTAFSQKQDYHQRDRPTYSRLTPYQQPDRIPQPVFGFGHVRPDSSQHHNQERYPEYPRGNGPRRPFFEPYERDPGPHTEDEVSRGYEESGRPSQDRRRPDRRPTIPERYHEYPERHQEKGYREDEREPPQEPRRFEEDGRIQPNSQEHVGKTHEDEVISDKRSDDGARIVGVNMRMIAGIYPKNQPDSGKDKEDLHSSQSEDNSEKLEDTPYQGPHVAGRFSPLSGPFPDLKNSEPEKSANSKTDTFSPRDVRPLGNPYPRNQPVETNEVPYIDRNQVDRSRIRERRPEQRKEEEEVRRPERREEHRGQRPPQQPGNGFPPEFPGFPSFPGFQGFPSFGPPFPFHDQQQFQPPHQRNYRRNNNEDERDRGIENNRRHEKQQGRRRSEERNDQSREFSPRRSRPDEEERTDIRRQNEKIPREQVEQTPVEVTKQPYFPKPTNLLEEDHLVTTTVVSPHNDEQQSGEGFNGESSFDDEKKVFDNATPATKNPQHFDKRRQIDRESKYIPANRPCLVEKNCPEKDSEAETHHLDGDKLWPLPFEDKEKLSLLVDRDAGRNPDLPQRTTVSSIITTSPLSSRENRLPYEPLKSE